MATGPLVDRQVEATRAVAEDQVKRTQKQGLPTAAVAIC